MQKASAFLSLLCAIHCMALPILATLMASSAFFSVLEHPIVEFLLLFPLIGMTIYSLYNKLKNPTHLFHFVLPLLGIIGVFIGIITHIHWLMGASALFLTISQWLHRRFAQKTACCSANRNNILNV